MAEPHDRQQVRSTVVHAQAVEGICTMKLMVGRDVPLQVP